MLNYQLNGLQITGFQHFVGGSGNDKFLIKKIIDGFSYDGGAGNNAIDLSQYQGNVGITANMLTGLLQEHNAFSNNSFTHINHFIFIG